MFTLNARYDELWYWFLLLLCTICFFENYCFVPCWLFVKSIWTMAQFSKCMILLAWIFNILPYSISFKMNTLNGKKSQRFLIHSLTRSSDSNEINRKKCLVVVGKMTLRCIIFKHFILFYFRGNWTNWWLFAVHS